MNRRAFLQSLLAVPAAAVAGAKIAPPPLAVALSSLEGTVMVPIPGTYGAIDRETYSFWRNTHQPPTPESFDALSRAMRNAAMWHDGRLR